MFPAPFADGSSPADQGRTRNAWRPWLAPSRRDPRARSGAVRTRAHARRLVLEDLERRELLAAMPLPVLIDSQNLTTTNNTGQHESAPVVAINPENPNQLVSVWTFTDPNRPAPTRTIVQGRISQDGGASWANFNPTPNVLTDPTTTNPIQNFSQVTDPTVAFDRNGNFYVLQLQSNGSNAGAVVLNRFNNTGASTGSTTVYSWNRAATAGSKAVLKPALAVDATTAFTDPTSGQNQSSPFQNRIYITWAADTPVPSPDPGNWNPATVELLTSTDSGLTFGAPVVVNAGGNSGSQRNGSPAITVSQGRAGGGGPAPGQITIVWDDYGSEATATVPRSVIRVARSTDGGATIAGRAALNTSDANRPPVGGASAGTVGTAAVPSNLLPAPVIASDNTLGSFSSFQGRLYIAYTGRDVRLSQNPADNTDIFVSTSDDGGASWTTPRRVNNDLAAADGFSEAAYDGAGRTVNGRPQFQPAATVDPVTGTVLISWFDTRHDAAEARVATYLAVSSDGGNDFSGQTYANRSMTPVDLVTRQTVNLGPIPDNQAAAGPGVNGSAGFGSRNGLVAFGGTAYLVWASNENGGNNGATPLNTRLSRVAYAAGPRILSGTSGPVGQNAPNNIPLADGSPVLRAFDVTFDRRVAVEDFGGNDVAIRWLSPDGLTSSFLNPATFAVAPLDQITINGVNFATQFRVSIPQQSAPGTYSYSIGPDIRDRIRARNGAFSSDGNAMDQNASDGTNLNDGVNNPADAFAVPGTTTGIPFATTINRDALPLIIPGPHVVSTNVPGYAATSDNLAVNGPVSALEVTFDREMNPTTFTTADILRVMGPAGDITRPARFGSTDIGRTIIDNGTTTSLLVVDNQVGNFTIADLDVRLDLNHPRLADLTVELIGPDNTVVRLVPTGTPGANFTGTSFDDEAPRTLSQSSAPYSSVFRPDQSLSAFDGKLLKGTWTLRVTDSVVGGGTGTIAGWSLVATPVAAFTVAPSGAAGPGGGYRSFLVGFPTQSLSGTYTIELGPNIFSQTGGLAVDSNRNAGVDALRQVPATTQDLFYASPQAPIPIPADTTVTSDLTIPDSFLITDVNLTLDISFTNDPDLEAYLVLPNSTEVRLFRNVGTTGNKTNFTGTVFDDQASTPIDIGGPPFSGRFRPQEPLDALNGTDAAGTYQLKIVNKSATLAGSLNSWSLNVQRAVASTGLGEAVADRISTSFRIFTTASTNSLASSTWTPIGPTSVDLDTRSGRISAIAVDPSDPSGNTVYIGGASGGVWKTTNFLTNDPDGPTWIPLTDFGPTFGLNVSAITIFPRNDDPNQSIIFAATGFPDSGTRGAGILRSTDGGASWTLLDSSNNNLPFSSSSRDRIFSNGTVQAYKLATDPRPGTSGVIVYAALNNGLWRSQDTGQTWTRLLNGAATDITFDLYSGTVDAASNPNGNLQIAYAAISGTGVFRTVNKGDSWSLLDGGVGKPFTRDNDVGGAPQVPVTNNPSPSGLGRIALAKPALVPATDTDSQRRNMLTQGWLYAAGISGTSVVLYQTKDSGQSWTRVELNLNANSTGSFLIPTNDTNAGELTPGGANNLAIEVDPNNPNIVYLGLAGNPTLIRVDTTAILDAHAFYLNSNLAGAASSARNAAGGVTVKSGAAFDGTRFFDPRDNPYINLLRNPDGILGEPNPLSPAQGPFDNTGYYVNSISAIGNSGAGAKWTQFEGGLQYLSLRSGFPAPTTGVHRMVMLKDPLTGRARLIVGDDHGLYTAVDNGEGRLLSAVGTASTPVGSRNGNLQLTQFYYGAIQPSSLTASGNTPAALLYGSTFQNGGLQSTGDILNTGNLNWAGAEANYSAGAVATDPQGSGAAFQYWFPGAGGNTTDFFQYAASGQSGLGIIGAGGAIGRTSGLINPNDPNWANTADLNFAINPLTNQQIIISSNSGRIYRTQNQGINWFDIGPIVGNQPQSLDGSPARAIAYGAPDPAVTGTNIDDFIYAGTRNGNVWVTTNGGQSWRNINAGLDGSPIMGIAVNPARGSHEAYIVTQNGVYHMPDSLATSPSWRNITGNLFGITHAIFGNPDLTETILKTGALKTLAVDWRYTLPDVRTNPDIYINPPTNPGDHNTTSPLIYIGGEGGVFRTVNNGATWRPFPAAEPSSLSTTPTPPGDGGGLPTTDVRDLDMSLGKIDPVTGRPIPVAGDPNMLVAWTFGRGAFGIRLAPIVLPDLIALDPRSPDIPGVRDGGSDSGNDDGAAYPPGPAAYRDKLTNVLNPFLAGYSQQSAFGTSVNITLYDLADPANPVYIGGYDPANPLTTAHLGLTDTVGRFANRDLGTGALIPGVQILAGLPGSGIPRLPDGLVRVGVQATDQAGVRGNMAIFEYTLDTTNPIAPAPVDLQAASDTGWKNDDDLINRNNASAPLAPVFDVGSLVAPVENKATVLLYRTPVIEGVPGTPLLVNRVTNVTPNASGVFAIADINTDFVVNPITGLVEPAPRGVIADGVYIYTTRQYDYAGNLSAESAGLTVTIETVAPTSPTPDLVDDDDTGRPRTPDAIQRDKDDRTYIKKPLFQGTVEPNGLVQLYVNGNAAGSARADALGYYTVRATIDLSEGANQITIRQTDIAGNLGPVSVPLVVTLDTIAPAAIPADLDPTSDSGPSNTDNYTIDTTPTFIGTAEPGALVQLYIQPTSPAGEPSILAGEAVADSSGAYAVTLGVYVLPLPPSTLSSLVDGAYNVTIRQLDVAGNAGPLSAALLLTIDTVTPAPTLAPDLNATSDSPASGQPGFIAGVTDIDDLTNVLNPTFTVSGVEPFALLQLLRDGTVVASITTTPGGAVAITDPGPVPVADPNTVHTYTAIQIDRAGNTSAVSGSLAVTFDTTPPVTPGAPDLQATSDSPAPGHPGFRAGITDTDNITNDTSPTFDVFNIEAKATVQLLRNGTVVATLVDVAAGTLSLTDPGAPNGTHVYTVRQYDFAGNLAAITGSLSVTIDSTVPATPNAPDLQAASDTPAPGHPGFRAGITDKDNITADNSPTFDASVIEAGATLELLRDGTVVATLVNVAAGTVAITDPSAPDGTHVYTVRQYDLAGNQSATSAGLTVTIDTTAPAAPATPDLQAASDTPATTGPGYRAGITDTDNLTADNSPTFDVAALEAGATLQLLRNGTVVATLVNVAAGTVAITDPSAPDGTHVYTAQQYDLAGNLGATSAGLTVTIDTAAPAAPTTPDLQTTSDTALAGQPGYRPGITDIDNTTYDNTPTFDVAALEAGATLQLLRNGTVVATLVNVAAGTVAITDPSAPSGTHVYTARQYDLAGNQSATSAGLTVTIDTTPPVATAPPDLQALSDTPLPGGIGYLAGTTDTDNITYDLSPTFDIAPTGVEPNAMVQLLRKLSTEPNTAYVVVAEGLGAAVLTDNTVPSEGGIFDYATRQVDLAGNVGPLSPSLRVIIDTAPPVPPVAPDLQDESDTGIRNNDDVTRITLFHFPVFDLSNIESTALAFLVRYDALGNRLVVNSRTGPGPINDPVPVADGVYRYTVYQVDVAGNISAESPVLTVTIDTTSPSSPLAPDLQAASDTGPSNTDNITAVTSPTFDIAGVEPGATLHLLRDGAIVATITDAIPSGGILAIQDLGPASPGTHVYSAYQVDPAGNQSPIGGSLTVIINGSVPTTPSLPDLVASSDSGRFDDDNITNALTPEFLVSGADLNARVELLRDGVVVASRTGPGTLRDDSPGPLADGVYAYTTRQITQAGNASSQSAALFVTIDRTALAPNSPDLVASSDTGTSDTDNITSDVSPTFDLSGNEPGATAQLIRQGVRYNSSTAGVAIPDSLVATTSTIFIPAGAGLLRVAGLRVVLDISVARASDLRAFLIAPDGTRIRLFANVGAGTGADFNGTILDDNAITPIASAAAPFSGSFQPDQSLAGLAGKLLSGNWTLELRDSVTGGGTTNRLNGWALDLDVAIERQGDGAVSDPGPLADGTHGYLARQIDLAGNVSPYSDADPLTPGNQPLVITVVSGSPAAPAAPDLQPGSDSGSSQTDNITSSQSLTFDVTGPAIVATNTVQLLRKLAGAPANQYVVVDSRTGPGSLTDPGPLLSGQYDYAARQLDLVGNLGTVSPSLTVTVDTNAPSAPATPDLQTASDTGNDNADNITADTSPSFDVNSGELGATAQLLRKPAGSPDSAYVVVASGLVVSTPFGPRATLTDPGPLAAGSYDYAALQTDPAGNTSPRSASLAVTIDLSTPATPSAPDLQATSDSPAPGQPGYLAGITDTDNITSAALLAFRIDDVTPGNNVDLLRRPAGSAAAFTVVSSAVVPNGQTFILLTDSPSNGVYEYAARHATASGAQSTSATALTVTVDRLTPAVPQLTLLLADDTGKPGDRRTTLRQPRLTGTTEPGALVELLNASGAVIATATASTAASGGVPAGSFTLQPPPGLLNGTHGFRAQARDAAGNASAPGANLALTLYSVAGDYDADGKTDYSVYWPSTGRILVGLNGGAINEALGATARDIPLNGDFDGDGRADLVVFQPNGANWRIRYSSTGQTVDRAFGNGAWTPLEGDYDGDGKADLAMFNPANATFYILYSGGGSLVKAHGNSSYIPITADFDGDGKTDVAVYNPTTTQFAILQSSAGPRAQVFGPKNAVPVPADYDGDGKADIAVYVPSSGQFQILQNNGLTRTVSLTPNAAPLLGDFDGDGKADPGTYQKSNGLWSISLSSTGAPRLQAFGGGEMVAIPTPISYRRPASPPPPPPVQTVANRQAPAQAAIPPAPAPAVPLGPLAIARRSRFNG